MKTTTEIIAEREAIQKEHERQDEFTEHELNKARKKCELLTKCLYYLEGNPSQEGMSHQIEWLKERLAFIENNFQNWYDIQPNAHQINKPKAQYRKEMRHKELKFQLKALNYITQ